jgi:hypothetical protein
MRKFFILYEAEADFEFTGTLKKLLGLSDDQVGELIERIDVDQLTDLVDACVTGDADAARKIVGAETESADVEKEDPDASMSSLLTPKDKAKAQVKKSKEQRDLRKTENELGEDTDSAIASFNIGDTVEVDGEEATVKIPSAPGDTVGVMIDGELKMVDKKMVRKLDEAVLGMTAMPGLKPTGDLQRIRELAGLPAEDFNEPPAPPAPPVAPTPAGALAAGEPPMDDHMDAPMAPEAPMDDMGGDMGGMEAGMDDGMGAEPMPALPAPDASMAPPMGPMDTGSALEDAAALDNAISEIENLIPNVKISEYKTLVARLKALVSMAESAGKAALTEAASKKVVKEGPLPFVMGSEFKSKAKPKGFDGEEAKFKKPSELDKRIAAFATNRRQGKVGEDKVNPKTVKEPKTDDKGRKTLMDYVREADEGMETIGMNRNDAMKAIQARMGPATDPQTASKTFDAMFASGHVKQVNGMFQMPAMNDQDFRTAIAQTGPSTTPTGGMSQQPDNTQTDQTQPGDQPEQESNAAPGTGGRQPNQARQS